MHTMIESSYLIPAIAIITAALVFYTFGVWGERVQHELRLWHVIAFLAGITCDFVGTGLMEHIARTTGAKDELHTITGFTAVGLMLIHAIWAVWTYRKGSPKAKMHFSRFSIFVWLLWLIPYGIGIYIGITH